ncbi:MAG: 50S ribosomal protein L18e [Candidatus Thermoplasmatota archaeon]
MPKMDANLVQLIAHLKKASHEHDAPIWRDIARRLEKPSSRWAEVNIGEIERNARDGDVIAIPGKLLGAGAIRKAVTVAPVRWSAPAKLRIESAGGKVIPLQELIAMNPKGARVLLMR